MENITYDHVLYVVSCFSSDYVKCKIVETNDNHTQLCNSN